MFLLLVSSIMSCKKEEIPPAEPQNGQITDSAALDAYVAFWDGDASWASGNGDWAEELSMTSWTNNGLPMGTRSFIKFTKISEVPEGATVSSAKLYLYPKGSSISNPLNGNSGYPGSPYSTDNACMVERVIDEDWNEEGITWNNQPGVTSTNAVLIPASNSQWDYSAEVDVTAMVKSILQDPSKNFGFRISLLKEDIYRCLIFASAENVNASVRPKLVIEYQK
ncbi:DNRLRE domain-containing protein [Panacibacter sp. DH6]|uniref:DNRLRE domain-containing protein n=1 Tax=Panacibacter microcysteis TaxID=2793269 RepID=A0A931GWC6_9BACT|nr:DNRLRE domain-containing protein [Panacibacter microcysteis]MBG9377470.1 DNRLRE domain-containing protein [Panacibacter microcysteis]